MNLGLFFLETQVREAIGDGAPSCSIIESKQDLRRARSLSPRPVYALKAASRLKAAGLERERVYLMMLGGLSLTTFLE